MSRCPLIAGNWKMNGTRENVVSLLHELKRGCKDCEGVEWVVFPPFIFIPTCEAILTDSRVAWGAQNVSEHEKGAYTGEVSAEMLEAFHCRYVIVGHSERRKYHHETNEQIAIKVKIALRNRICPIICLGESEEQREAKRTLKVVQEQLAVVLRMNDNLGSSEIVIAYEPVWAIGTGKQATPDQAQEVHVAIRHQLHRYDAKLAETTRILYGGSVKADNARPLFAMPDIDGALVGGASLQMKQFLEIGQQCN